MPPKVSAEQITKLATSLARGTPDALKIARTIVRDRIREISEVLSRNSESRASDPEHDALKRRDWTIPPLGPSVLPG